MKRDLGSHKIDKEPYFDMWNCVLFAPSSEASEGRSLLSGHAGSTGTIPCFQHKTCGALVKCEDVKPPRTCPHCHADTAKEIARGIAVV